MPSQEEKRAELRRAALEYHEFPTPGKIAIAPTKSLLNQRDLALAYSPGVAAACEEIVADPDNAGPRAVRATGRLCYASGNRAVTALGHLWQYAQFRQRRGLA